MADTVYLVRSPRPDVFVYNIDVAGTCDLRCASCPVGNSAAGARGRGFMAYERFAAIIGKVVREAPAARPVIALYNWGEPLLHPDIGRMIELVRSHGLYCAVSTNLNQPRFLGDVVRARPSNLKISLSGFSQPVYRRTHGRGNIEKVKDNMRRLRDLAEEAAAPTEIFVGYHRYMGNVGEELASMESLAHELGFALRQKIGRLYPLEKLLPLMRGEAPVAADRPLVDILLVKPAEWREIGLEVGQPDECSMRSGEMAINFDGSVSLCCNVYDPVFNVAGDFLAVSHEGLQERKDCHGLCGECMRCAYPVSGSLDAHPKVQLIAAARAAGSTYE